MFSLDSTSHSFIHCNILLLYEDFSKNIPNVVLKFKKKISFLNGWSIKKNCSLHIQYDGSTFLFRPFCITKALYRINTLLCAQPLHFKTVALFLQFIKFVHMLTKNFYAHFHFICVMQLPRKMKLY